LSIIDEKWHMAGFGETREDIVVGRGQGEGRGGARTRLD